MGTARTSPKVVRERRAKGIRSNRGHVRRHFPKSERNERNLRAMARDAKVENSPALDVDIVLTQEVEAPALGPIAPEPIRNRRKAVVPPHAPTPKVAPECQSCGRPLSGRRLYCKRKACLPAVTANKVQADGATRVLAESSSFRVRDRKWLTIARAILPDDADPRTFTHQDVDWVMLAILPTIAANWRELNLTAIRNELEWLIWDRDGWRHIAGDQHVA